MTALRDSVIAGLSEPRFLELVERQPRLLVELGARAVTRAETVERRSTASNVIALLNLTGAELVGPFVDALAPFGVVETIDASRIDRQLGVEGIADSAAGEPGEVSVSRLLREAEMAAEHLILDIGDGLGAFAQRCMGTADRLLIALPSEPSLEILEKARAKLTRAPSGLERWICLIHQSVDATPGGTGAIVDALGATAVVHAVFGDAGSFQRAARVFAGRGNVLVLSGGGGRGFAHIGVVRALNELGIPIDIVGGTSMGAILGAAIADGLTPDALVEWAHRHFPRSLDYTFPVVGLVKVGRIVESARHTFGNRTIEDLWRGYFAVSTDLTTARIHVHRRGRIDVVVRATSAIPGVMPPVPFGSSLLVDGGVLNNLPIDVARDDSPGGQVIAVDVAPSQGPRAHSDYGLAVSGWKALGAGLGGRRSPFPRISAVLMRSMITASLRERDDLVQGGLADCYLPLDMRGVSMLDFSDPRGVAERGYETAMPFLTAWLEGRSVTDRESDRR